MEKHNNEIGNIGEHKASNYLKNHGYKIRERNFRAKTGEIDIIAEKNGVTAFVEVKTRTQEIYGIPAEAVNYYKQKNIIKTANVYLMRYGFEKVCRFDVIEVFLTKNIFGYKAKINHIENAFGEF